MSANDATEYRSRANQAGCDAYMTKPFTMKTLYAIINELDVTSHTPANSSAAMFKTLLMAGTTRTLTNKNSAYFTNGSDLLGIDDGSRHKSNNV